MGLEIEEGAQHRILNISPSSFLVLVVITRTLTLVSGDAWFVPELGAVLDKLSIHPDVCLLLGALLGWAPVQLSHWWGEGNVVCLGRCRGRSEQAVVSVRGCWNGRQSFLLWERWLVGGDGDCRVPGVRNPGDIQQRVVIRRQREGWRVVPVRHRRWRFGVRRAVSIWSQPLRCHICGWCGSVGRRLEVWGAERGIWGSGGRSGARWRVLGCALVAVSLGVAWKSRSIELHLDRSDEDGGVVWSL